MESEDHIESYLDFKKKEFIKNKDCINFKKYIVLF